jgi:hypothetical protein
MTMIGVMTPVRNLFHGCFYNLDRSCCFEAIIMPDDVALEKVKALEALGADIERVRPASIVDKKQASQTPVDLFKYCRLLVLSFL